MRVHSAGRFAVGRVDVEVSILQSAQPLAIPTQAAPLHQTARHRQGSDDRDVFDAAGASRDVRVWKRSKALRNFA